MIPLFRLAQLAAGPLAGYGAARWAVNEKKGLQNNLTPKVAELKKQFPDASNQMLYHYLGSQRLDKEYPYLPTQLGGFVSEGLDVLGGSKGGFSVDDLGANYAGHNLNPQEAYDRGFFNVTEPADNWVGYGQGDWRTVWDKVSGD